MNRIDKYKKALDKITPSAELVEITKLKMDMAFSSNKPQRNIIKTISVAAASVLIIFAAIFFISTSSSAGLSTDDLSITPTEQTNGFVSTTTDFIITAATGKLPDQNTMEKLITITPETDFSIEKLDDSYLLTTSETFASGDLIKLTLTSENGSEKRWAFQTDQRFQITDHFPANGAEYVDCDTGIEITFSSTDVTVASFTDAFSISPSTAGHIVKNGSVFAFIPDEPLISSTRYTISISDSLSTEYGESLEDIFALSFTTTPYAESYGEPGQIFNWESDCENFLPDDSPVIKYCYTGDVSDEDVNVSVWSYENADEYKNALKNYITAEKSGEIPSLDTDNLNPVTNFSTDTDINNDSFRYAVFPEPLETGWYAAELTANDGHGGECSLIKFIQVSDIAVYALDTGETSVFWLNSSHSGQPLNSAELTLESGTKTITGRTDSDGVAYISSSDISENGLIDIAFSNERYLSLWQPVDSTENASKLYYSYIYSDRPIYHTTDTISFWGIVSNRTGGELPKQVRATLDDGENILYSSDIILSPDGTFSGELSFDGLTGWMTLSLEIDGEAVYSQYIEICDYDKPLYSIEIDLDNSYCFAGDEITANITVSFFDGTPAPGIQLEAFIDNDSNGVANVTTDGHGAATVTLTADITETDVWYPVPVLFTVRALIDGNVPSESTAWLSVAPSDTALYGSFDNEKNRLNVYTDAVDITGISDDDEIYQDNYAAIRGEAVEKKVYGHLYRVWYTKKVSGSYYDFSQKNTVKTYDYIPHEQVIKTYKFQTADGYDYIDNLPEPEDGESYYVVLSTTDSNGKSVRYTVYLNNFDNGFDLRGHYFQFERLNAENEYEFSEGDSVELQLCDGTDAVSNGRMLSVIAGLDTIQHVSGSTTVNIPYSDSLIPNFVVYGAWFDGSHVYAVQEKYLSFDPAQRELSIDIVGSNNCSPGSDVPITVTVKDADGTPVSNISGVLMVADEAAFAGYDHQPYILQNLYRSVYFNSEWKTYLSYHDYMSLFDIGGRGSGAENVRSDFCDTAGMYTFTTDSSGRAKITVSLPDNITSWRLTAAAAGNGNNGNFSAGETISNISSGLDFFINPIFPDEIIAGDDFTVTIRSFGSSLDDREHTVEYTCTLKSSYRPSLSDPGSDITLRTTCSAGDYIPLDFGKPDAGEYTVTITANCGELSDSIELPLTVLESAAEVLVTRDISIDDIYSLSPVKYPITLYISNADAHLQSAIVSETLLSDGYRADQRLARTLLSRTSDSLHSVSDILSSNGISAYSYAEKDPLLTAQIVAAFGDSFKFSDMSEYFRSILSDPNATSSDVAAAYLGLAASGKPVLADIRSLIKDDENFTLYDRLILTAALAVIGDDDGAETYLDTLTRGIISTRKNSDGFSESYISIDGSSDEETLRLTSMALMASSLLRSSRADAFAEYLSTHTSRNDITLCPLLCYFTHSASTGSTAKVSYTLDGIDNAVKLDFNHPLVLTLSREQLAALQLKCVSGSVSITAHYYSDIDDISSHNSGTLTLTKSFSGNGSYSVGDKAIVSLDVGSIQTNCAFITDHIPAGMRFLSLTEDSEANGWHIEYIDGQNIRFVWFPETESQSPQTLSYSAVCVNSGSYISECAYVSLPDISKGFGLSERDKITISERALPETDKQ